LSVSLSSLKLRGWLSLASFSGFCSAIAVCRTYGKARLAGVIIQSVLRSTIDRPLRSADLASLRVSEEVLLPQGRFAQEHLV
jgi:hypothetical protein